MDRIGHYINNAVITDEANKTSPVFNPAVGKQIAEVELASKSQVEEAISAAAAAFVTDAFPALTFSANFKCFLISDFAAAK